MPELFEAGVISESVFSFYLTDLSDNSYIDFGTPNTSVMTSESDLIWIDSNNYRSLWTNNVTGWRWSGSATEYSLESTWALTDTGSSCVYGP